MAYAQKKEGKIVEAFQLGQGTEKEQQMITEGKIIDHHDGTYELFSQEAVNGEGEMAKEGDYFKIDNAGYPYPNAKKWFEENHRTRPDGTYEQIPHPLQTYEMGEQKLEEVQFLIDSGKLKINPDDVDKFFNAELWGSQESAPANSVKVIYGVTRDDEGIITDIDFNFVARDEFDQTYDYVEIEEERSADDSSELTPEIFRDEKDYEDNFGDHDDR